MVKTITNRLPHYNQPAQICLVVICKTVVPSVTYQKVPDDSVAQGQFFLVVQFAMEAGSWHGNHLLRTVY